MVASGQPIDSVPLRCACSLLTSLKSWNGVRLKIGVSVDHLYSVFGLGLIFRSIVTDSSFAIRRACITIANKINCNTMLVF